MDALQELLKIQKKQGWKEKALLRLIINWIKSTNDADMTADASLVAYVQQVANDDNANIQALSSKLTDNNEQ